MITEIITKEQPSQLTSYIIVVVKKDELDYFVRLLLFTYSVKIISLISRIQNFHLF